jgi:hypothetical protein
MKLYCLKVDMLMVLSRLKAFNLYEFNHPDTIIFLEAKNADDACYRLSCKFSELLLKQDESIETAELIKELVHDIRITEVVCKDET